MQAETARCIIWSVMAVVIGDFDTKGCCLKQHSGGAGGIRTLDRALQPYNGLANRRLQPLGHSSVVVNQALKPVRPVAETPNCHRIATGTLGLPFLTCSQRRLDRLGRSLVGS